MKKILILIPIVALIMAILPQAQAGDQAGLKVMVKFDINHPPYWVTEPPADYKVIEGDLVEIGIAAADPDGDLLIFKCVHIANGMFVEELPLLASSDGRAKLTWEVPLGLDLDAERFLEFSAFEVKDIDNDGMPDPGTLRIVAKTALRIIPRTISIEIYPMELAFKLKLNDKASEIVSIGNSGTVPVEVAARYNMDFNFDGQVDDHDIAGLRPGLQPGPNTFVTAIDDNVNWKTLPPNGDKVLLDGVIGAGQKLESRVAYYSPTEITIGEESHDFVLEIIASEAPHIQ